MALTRSKKSRGNAKDAEVSPVDDVNEKSPSVSVETEADGSREETFREKPETPAQSVSESEKDLSQGKKWLKKAHNHGSLIAEFIYCSSLPKAQQKACKF